MRFRSALYGAGVAALIGSVALVTGTDNPIPLAEVEATTIDGIETWACPAGTVGRVQCAFVEVPEDYDDPDIRQIKLFAARVQPPLRSTAEPIVVIGDELGVVNVDELGEWQRFARAVNRDIVLVDLRGTGRSVPRLACLDVQRTQWLQSDLRPESRDQAVSELTDALDTCRDQLSEQVELAAYSLDSIVADLELVRRRLSIESWSILAGGDATEIARQYDASYPEAVVSMALMGAAPWVPDRRAARYDYAREVLDAALGTDGVESLESALEPLGERSIVFAVSGGGRTRRVAVSAEVTLPVVARMAGNPQYSENLNGFVESRLADGQQRVIATIRSQQFRIGPSWSLAGALMVACGDPGIADAEPLWDAVAGFDPAWTGLVDDLTLIPELCTAWSTRPHEVLTAGPASPTLVINGEYDSFAPTSAATVIDASWPTATVVLLPQSGRPDPFDNCVLDLISSFLDGQTSNMTVACP